jgi:hypothetical protein
MYPSREVSDVKNHVVIKVINILSTITVPDHPDCPSTMFISHRNPSDEDPSDVSSDVHEYPSNASTDVSAEEQSIATDLPPPLYDPVPLA